MATDRSLGSALLGFFSGTGAIVFLFALLFLLVLIGLVAGAVAWISRGRANTWASRASRLTFRA